MRDKHRSAACLVAVIWIDWYPYHVARFRGLESAPTLRDGVVGIELVGGVGVHQGLKFRESLPVDARIETLMPEASWGEVNKLTLARMLWKRLDALQPEIVLVPGYYTLPAICAAVWARLHGRTSVLMTESTAGDHRRTWWKELPKQIALRTLFDWAVTGGRAHVEYLRQLGFRADRIVSGYDVVNNEMFATGAKILRQQEATPPTRSPYFLYVGRLAEEKNVQGLLASWTAYREQGGSWPLVLCGDGPERAALEKAAASSAFGSDVVITGLKTSHELLPFYAHAGCFVLPSTREPWGLVVNEAMAAGLPVLVSKRCGCSVDLVQEGVNGFVFDPENRSELSALLQRMEAMPVQARIAMGSASGELIRRFSPEHFGEAIAVVLASRHRAVPAVAITEVAS